MTDPQRLSDALRALVAQAHALGAEDVWVFPHLTTAILAYQDASGAGLRDIPCPARLLILRFPADDAPRAPGGTRP